MALVVHYLKCTADDSHLFVDVFHRRGELPVCDYCGAATVISWHSGRAPGLVGFGQMVYNNQAMSTNDFEGKVQQLRKSNPGKEVRVVSDSDSKRRARAEQRLQRLHRHRQKRGIDAQGQFDRHLSAMSKQREALDRGTVAPKNPSQTVASMDRQIDRFKKSVERNK